MNVALFIRIFSSMTSKDLAAAYSDADYKLIIIKIPNDSQWTHTLKAFQSWVMDEMIKDIAAQKEEKNKAFF